MTLSISFSASADAVKQYVLTKIGYPIIVNGKEYSDPKFPALGYNGATYLLLKAVEDVLKYADVQGGSIYNGHFLVPIQKFYTSLDMPGYAIENDDQNKMIYITPN